MSSCRSFLGQLEILSLFFFRSPASLAREKEVLWIGVWGKSGSKDFWDFVFVSAGTKCY